MTEIATALKSQKKQNAHSCLRKSLLLLASLLIAFVATAQAQGDSCQVYVPVRFKGSTCPGPSSITLNGRTVSTSGPCTSTSWATTEEVITSLKPDQTYQVTAGGGSCSTHIVFDVPEGYTLFINGRETTTIDKSGNTPGSGGGTWDLVLREECPCNGEPISTPGGSSGPRLGSVNWSVSLGKLSDGRTAESISLRENTIDLNLNPDIYTPAVLVYSPPALTNEVDVVRTANGRLRQIKATETLADIVVINQEEYDIRFYLPSQVGSKVNGIYSVSGQPFRVWKIKNSGFPPGTKLQILKIENGVTETNEYTWNEAANSWSLSTANGAHIETLVETTPQTNTRVEVVTVKNNLNVIASKIKRTYFTFAWGEELKEEIVDPDAAALTTVYNYYQNSAEAGRYGRLMSVIYPDGSWEKYDYDASGNKTLVMKPWKDLALEAATPANSHTVNFYYTNNNGFSGDLSLYSRFLHRVEEKIAGTLVRSSEYRRAATTINGMPAIIESKSVFSSLLGVEETATVTYHPTAPAAFANRVASINYSDQRMDTYSYEKGNYITNNDPSLNQFTPETNGLAERTTVVHGIALSPNGLAFSTTKETTVRDDRGNEVLKEMYVYDGTNYERVSWTVNTYDARGHLTQSKHSNGQVYSASWNGDLKGSEISETGIETVYEYDALNRVHTKTHKGVARTDSHASQPDAVTTYTYDAEGRQTSETISSQGLSLSNSTSYDSAGRIKNSTERAGLITTYQYSQNGRSQTIILPGGATQITEKYLDGKTKSTTGTSVVGKYFDYDVNPDGTRYTIERIGDAGMNSPRWTKTTLDWNDHVIRVETPSFTGANLIRNFKYESNTGRLMEERLSDGTNEMLAVKIYKYDELGHPSQVGYDINGDENLSAASTDRLAETDTRFEKNGNDWFKVTTTKTYLTDNNALATTVAQKERLTNFPFNDSEQLVSEITLIDEAGNQTIISTLVDRAAKKVITTNNSPDSVSDSRNLTLNGLLVSSTPATSQAATTYSYDPLRRLKSFTDPRTGNSTKTYNPSTGQLLSESNGPNSTGFDYYPSGHVSAGRIKSQTNAQGKKVYFNYNLRGEIIQTWGAGTYPVEYVYDSYGHRQEMRTFRGGSGWSSSLWPTTRGTADVTQWIYHEATGLLNKKEDATGQQVIYTYDILGRLKARTWARRDAGNNPLVTTYSYDPKTGELTLTDYSDNTPDVGIGYDRGGRTASVVDAAGTHAMTFNLKGALKKDEITGGILDGTKTEINFDDFLRRASLQASRNSTVLTTQTLEYDSVSRLSTVSSNGYTATYGYHSTHGLLSSTSIANNVISRTYDSLGRLKTIATTPTAGNPVSYTYSYDNLNRREKVTREDGSSWSFGYNDRGEVVSGKKYWANGAPVAGQQFEHDFDNLGNRKMVRSGGNQLGSGLRQSNYTANALNQYTQRVVPGAIDVFGTANSDATVTINNQQSLRQGSYFYKELVVDNANSSVYASVSVAAVKNNAGPNGEDAVTQTTGHRYIPKALETYTYDADGNLLSDGRWVYTWDAENRLAGMTALPNVPDEAKKKLEFSYDSQGRRIQKKVYAWNAGLQNYQLQFTRKFIYDGWNMIAELDGGNNALIRSYVWSIEGLLFVNDGGNTYHVGYDGNENVVALVKANSGAISALYEYDQFGNLLKSTGEYASHNPFKFSTKYTDQESGFLYYGYRYYNPQTGAWLSKDPTGETGGLNLYNFVRNDGVNAIDHLGLWKRSSWTGSRGDYSGTATTESCDTLSELAYTITGYAADWRYLGISEKLRKGQTVNIAPLLVKFEERLRDKVVEAAFNFRIPNFTPHGQLSSAFNNEADIQRAFKPNNLTAECLLASLLVLSEGVANSMRKGEFDKLNYASNLPIKETTIPASRPDLMKNGDVGYIKTYPELEGRSEWQGANFIKLNDDDGIFSHPFYLYSFTDLPARLQSELNRTDPIIGFTGNISFVDVAQVAMDRFDLRQKMRR